ncbi:MULTISPECIES: YfiT family bacillithiol transferase [Aequorivita]|uniref:Metal-dependent hydrolase n=1 Tax=Aequorivita iocasae TaxID=2803865 RepID=A0ABX7DWM6_9FLAO|nr:MULTISPECIES: putative metal-dependent hydrolase [Aequorivita]QQX78127.1 putative metal-dependent hydrolase [Aequorivita iocasae]UCA57640.1 putative metal-dependent hydrolase [Aequorivita sp. F7]
MREHNLKYPIGHFVKPVLISRAELVNWIEIIETFPEVLQSEIETLADNLLDTPYREGGWTVRQVVHHCADSHINAFIRFKLALTEDNPVIKPYNEALWAEISDSKSLPVEFSLSILKGLHYRWYFILKNTDDDMFKRKYTHPEHGTEFTLEEAIGMYAWHCSHHLAHIKLVKHQSERP